MQKRELSSSTTKTVDSVKKRKKPLVRSGAKPYREQHPGQLEMNLDSILESMEKNAETSAMIRLMLQTRTDEKQWRGMLAVPPAGLAAVIISEFRQKTNIPLEIPFFTLLSVISGMMLKRGTVLESTALGEVRPDIWTVVLASSGAGKTYTHKQITKNLDLTGIEFAGGFASAATFVDALNNTPNSLWIRDEFAQFLKVVEADDGPMAGIKDYMLRLYDNETIARNTKRESVEVKEPAVSIFGLTVLETFGKYVSSESMLDGFAQRFSYVKAETDPERPFKDYPLWLVDSTSFNNEWEKVRSCIKDRYYVDDEIIMPAFSQSFNSLFNDAIPESFFRRMIWRATKYAMIYHVLRADNSEFLTPEDFGWAARVLSLHVKDAAWLLGEHTISDLEKVIVSTENAIERLRAKNGRDPKLREIVQYVKAIKTVSQAKQIMSLLGYNV